MTIRFDDTVAANLSSQLRVLSEKLRWMAWYRGQQCSLNLNAPIPELSGGWLGRRRTVFDGEYHDEQRRLTRLADSALAIKGQVDKAIQDADAARKTQGH
ncbi:hypothetical protein ABH935_001426 [Catenulispora sp. GAS73]|uniref:hypothetical protein n=1 Tax=Catenulispora sp. GAS73 TaxID=3156269 RepID=UPI003513AC41